MLYDDNLIEMSLRLNRSEPIFRTITEVPGIGRRPRTRDDIRQSRNLPYSYMIVRQKPEQTIMDLYKSMIVPILTYVTFARKIHIDG